MSMTIRTETSMSSLNRILSTSLHLQAGKPNRAILFNGHMPHGPCIGTDQFTKETRYTQVAFATIQ